MKIKSPLIQRPGLPKVSSPSPYLLYVTCAKIQTSENTTKVSQTTLQQCKLINNLAYWKTVELPHSSSGELIVRVFPPEEFSHGLYFNWNEVDYKHKAHCIEWQRPHTGLDTFHKFPKLPIELRIKIWEYALPEPQVIDLSICRLIDNMSFWLSRNGQRLVRDFLWTNKEAASVFNGNYHKISLCSTKPKSTKPEQVILNEFKYFGIKRDTLVVDIGDLVRLEERNLGFDFSAVENLVLLNENALETGPPVWAFAQAICPRLKTFAISPFSGKWNCDYRHDFQKLPFHLITVDEKLRDLVVDVDADYYESVMDNSWWDYKERDTEIPEIQKHIDTADDIYTRHKTVLAEDSECFWGRIDFKVVMMGVKGGSDYYKDIKWIIPVEKQEYDIAYYMKQDGKLRYNGWIYCYELGFALKCRNDGTLHSIKDCVEEVGDGEESGGKALGEADMDTI